MYTLWSTHKGYDCVTLSFSLVSLLFLQLFLNTELGLIYLFYHSLVKELRCLRDPSAKAARCRTD